MKCFFPRRSGERVRGKTRRRGMRRRETGGVEARLRRATGTVCLAQIYLQNHKIGSARTLEKNTSRNGRCDCERWSLGSAQFSMRSQRARPSGPRKQLFERRRGQKESCHCGEAKRSRRNAERRAKPRHAPRSCESTPDASHSPSPCSVAHGAGKRGVLEHETQGIVTGRCAKQRHVPQPCESR